MVQLLERERCRGRYRFPFFRQGQHIGYLRQGDRRDLDQRYRGRSLGDVIGDVFPDHVADRVELRGHPTRLTDRGVVVVAGQVRLDIMLLVVIGATGEAEIRTAMNHGAFDFATKPIDMEDLERTIEKAVEQISFIKEAQKEHHQLEEIQYDLNVAREIQQSILPKQFPPFPQYKQFDLYATMSAAKAVGGDFYDFFLVDDNHLGFTIADVSDKGIPAAIFMAISRTVIRATALRQLSPAVCMKESNDLLCRESVNGMFVTTFYAILNIHTGDVVYCNGGHNRPVWIRKNDKVSLLPMTGGMALGVVPGLAYKEQSLKLEAGDSLFLYTDGISEAMNRRNEQYGDIRLVEACSSVKNQSPKAMIEGISESVQSFVNGATQSDDITMLALTYKGQIL